MDPQAGVCVFLTRDLLFSSRVRSAAADCGVSVCLAGDEEQLVQQVTADPGGWVLLDLTHPGLQVAALLNRLRSLPDPPRAVVAFGPHVQETLLAEARVAGCDAVWTRGEFNKRLPSVFNKYARTE